MIVEVWASQSESVAALHAAKGKGKERADRHDDAEVHLIDAKWKVLETWNVDLNDLIPFPDTVRDFGGSLQALLKRALFAHS